MLELTWNARPSWEATEAWKITYCMSVSVHTVSNMSLGRSLHSMLTIEYPFWSQFSIETAIFVPLSVIFISDELLGPSKSLTESMSWCNLLSTLVMVPSPPRNPPVFTSRFLIWNGPVLMLGSMLARSTVIRWSSMEAKRWGSSIGVWEDWSEMYATQAKQALWLQAWASTMLQWRSAKVADISEKSPGLSVPDISMAVCSFEWSALETLLVYALALGGLGVLSLVVPIACKKFLGRVALR